MIDFYTWRTPNGYKISIMLEECGLPYQVFPIDITKNQQFAPDYLKISPNNKIPTIVDQDGPGGKPLPLFESGAILVYLAEKTGKYLSTDSRQRYATFQWLMWQMGGFGPMLGQAHHFRRFASEKIPYAIERYTTEAKRLYGVLEKRLSEAPYLAGDYSIADMAVFPWATRHEWQGIEIAELPHVKRWLDAIGARAAVKAGLAVP